MTTPTKLRAIFLACSSTTELNNCNTEKKARFTVSSQLCLYDFPFTLFVINVYWWTNNAFNIVWYNIFNLIIILFIISNVKLCNVEWTVLLSNTSVPNKNKFIKIISMLWIDCINDYKPSLRQQQHKCIYYCIVLQLWYHCFK